LLLKSGVHGVERLLTIDLQTGHGPRGAATFLSDLPIGSARDQFLREHFGAAVEGVTTWTD